MTLNNVWTETYRPKVLADIVGQNDITNRLSAYVKEKSMPHLLFAGRQGTGKTTAAYALARELYGEYWSGMITKLDASDDRGIAVVRNEIKTAASLAPPADIGFRIIILDEADGLTRDAQQALRRTIERYSHITRFVLLCNYVNKIIEPIQSRCSMFRFRKVDSHDIMDYIGVISDKEKLQYESPNDETKCLLRISEKSNGDVRRATLILMDLAITCPVIKLIDVLERFPYIDDKLVAGMIREAIQGNLSESYRILDEMYYSQRYYADEILETIYKYVTTARMTPHSRFKIVSRIAETDDRLTRSCNEVLQLQALLEYIHGLVEK